MEDLEEKMWLRVKKYLRFLCFVPFLRMVAVCNNLAFSNTNEKSDIDLFIIAKAGRLFLVRILVTGILHVLGVRRHDDKVAGRFCLSFFVDDSFLDLSPIAIENDVYLKIWIKTLIPVIDDGVGRNFLAANSWIRADFEDFLITLKEPIFVYHKTNLKISLEWFLNGKFGNFLENFLKKWQKKRARSKMHKIGDSAGILINDHILKFHNFDRRQEYRGLWQAKFRDSKISLEKFRTLIPN
ncbi:hypothetical protein HZA40_00220 [Candidatus Peregrinibacteria bacterium]|nr:hypothetical protein [Candidatus Peregrinibacteria bacterium]